VSAGRSGGDARGGDPDGVLVTVERDVAEPRGRMGQQLECGLAVGRGLQREPHTHRRHRSQPVCGLHLVDEQHLLAAQHRQIHRLPGRLGQLVQRGPELRRQGRVVGTAQPEQSFAEVDLAFVVDAREPDLDQSNQQPPNRGLGQAEPSAEVDQPKLPWGSGDLVQGGRGTTQYLNSV